MTLSNQARQPRSRRTSSWLAIAQSWFISKAHGKKRQAKNEGDEYSSVSYHRKRGQDKDGGERGRNTRVVEMTEMGKLAASTGDTYTDKGGAVTLPYLYLFPMGDFIFPPLAIQTNKSEG